MALALESGQDVAGLVLLSGYYYPTGHPPRRKAAPVTSFSLVDDVFRQAMMPLVWRLAAPGAVKRIFAPCAVPERFKQLYSIPDALRPSQMKAVAEEAAMLAEAVDNFGTLYKELSTPVQPHRRVGRRHRRNRSGTPRGCTGSCRPARFAWCPAAGTWSITLSPMR